VRIVLDTTILIRARGGAKGLARGLILAGEMLHDPADAVLRLASDDQVNVVRHEGLAIDEDLAQVGMVVQKGEEFGAVLIAE